MPPLNQHAVDATQKIFSRILVPTDFSEVSRRAFFFALALAARFDLQVYLAHVITNPPASPQANASHTSEAERQSAEERLHKFTSALPDGTPSFTCLLEEGQLWDAADRLVHKYGIDLIVAGTRGVGARPQPALGSGAEQIFRHATCPVLTIGPSTAPEELAQIQFRSVLFVTDFGPDAEHAALFAIAVARKYGARFAALHVVEDSGAPSRLELDHLTQIHIQHMRHELATVDRTFSPSQFCVRFGNAADEILKKAQEITADLIVMGSKTRSSSGWAGHVPLSTAYNVVAKAVCPVLTVRAGRPHSHYVSSPSD